FDEVFRFIYPKLERRSVGLVRRITGAYERPLSDRADTRCGLREYDFLGHQVVVFPVEEIAEDGVGWICEHFEDLLRHFKGGARLEYFFVTALRNVITKMVMIMARHRLPSPTERKNRTLYEHIAEQLHALEKGDRAILFANLEYG